MATSTSLAPGVTRFSNGSRVNGASSLPVLPELNLSGDGGPAVHAKIDGPGGPAVARNDDLFFTPADAIIGTGHMPDSVIRRVVIDGVIHTVAG